jgi:molecular chaperone GrpE
MRKRDGKHGNPASRAEPPVAEPQGDGEPSPGDIEDRVNAEGGDGASAAEATGSASGSGGPTTVDASGDAARQLEEQRDKYLRLAAEYDNYRRRSMKERSEAATRGQAELVGRMMEAIDDLGRFADVDPTTTDAVTLHQGVEMVEQKLIKALTASGLEVIDPVDQSFDPNLHEAVATEPALSSEDDNTVSRVYQKGYRFSGQLLRPARVLVKQWQG